ncbi:hypothetical protein MRX96_035060 [Rhipicephalus microplus]
MARDTRANAGRTATVEPSNSCSSWQRGDVFGEGRLLHKQEQMRRRAAPRAALIAAIVVRAPVGNTQTFSARRAATTQTPIGTTVAPTAVAETFAHRPPKSQEHRMSRGTCAPVLMMVLLMAFLVLVSLVIMAHSNRNMAVISGAGHANAANQIPHMVMSSSATITNVHAPALPVGASKGVKSTGSLEVSRNVSSLRVTRRVAATPTFAAEVTVRKRSSVKKYTRHVKPRKRTTVSLNFGATEDSADIMAFPFQRPMILIRISPLRSYLRRLVPMCGDVFYSLCHPEP